MKQSQKRAVATASGLIFVAGLMVGCSGPPSAEPSSAEPSSAERSSAEPSNGPVALSQSWWGGTTRAPLQQAVVDLYVKAHPNVSVEQQLAQFEPYWDKLAVQASSHNLADVTQLQDRYLTQFYSALLDLKPYIDDGTIDIKGIDPAVLAAGQVNGKQVMIPSSFSYRAVLYSSDLFAKAGVDAPGLTTTWAELATNLKTLADSGALPNGTYAATNQCYSDAPFYAYLNSNGATAFDGDTPAFTVDDAASYYSWWHGLQEAGVVPPPAFQTTNEGLTVEDTMLAKGMTALSMPAANQFAAAQASRKDKLKLAPVPVGSSGAGNELTVSGQSIGANSKQPKAAAEFINFFVNDTGAAVAYKGDNGLPSASAARQALIASQDLYAVSFYDTIRENFVASKPKPKVASRVSVSLARTCDQVAYGQATPKQAAATLLADLTAP